MSYQKHPTAIVETPHVGKDTRIWAFTHILPRAQIGANCNICDHVFIENEVTVGDNVTIKCGVQLWDGVHLADNVFVGPNATFTNDLFPRSKIHKTIIQTHVGKGVSVGANATILCGIQIGSNALIGAGAVVTKSIPDNAIVVGNPARIVGYADSVQVQPNLCATRSSVSGTVKGESDHSIGQYHRLPLIKDARGDLTVGEYPKDLPFVPKRYFLVYNVPSKSVRGEHAHFQCHQFLICVRGSMSVLLDNGTQRETFILNEPNFGVYIPPMTWAVQFNHTYDSLLLVLASHPYQASDYIRDYATFQKEIQFKAA